MFTTCGSAAKRTFLQQTFPWLDEAHIGDSRSTAFEATVLDGVQSCPRPLLHVLIFRHETGPCHASPGEQASSCIPQVSKQLTRPLLRDT